MSAVITDPVAGGGVAMAADGTDDLRPGTRTDTLTVLQAEEHEVTGRRVGSVMRPALLGAVFSLAMAACGGDGSVLLGTPPVSSSTSEAPVTSQAPPTTGTTAVTVTTVAPATTATTMPPTTTVPPETTVAPVTTETTATTSPPVTLGPPPEPLEFLQDGLNITDFGDTHPTAVGAVQGYLGMDPTFDSNWGPAWGDYGACPGTEYRQVEFGGLTLMFTDAGYFAPEGTRQLFAWSYDGNPPGITMGTLDIGMTVGDLQALYPAVTIYGGDPVFGDTFRVVGPGQEQLWGRLSGTGAGDTIEHLVGGVGCGE